MATQQDTYDFLFLLGDALIKSGASAASSTKTLLAVADKCGLQNVTISITMGQLVISDSRGDDQIPYTDIHELEPGVLDISWRASAEEIIEDFLMGNITAEQATARLRRENKEQKKPSWILNVIGFAMIGMGFSQIVGAGWVIMVGATITSLLVSTTLMFMKNARTPGIFKFALGGFLAVHISALFCILTHSNDVVVCIVSALASYLAGAAAYGAVQDAVMGWYLSSIGKFLDALICTAGLITGVSVGVAVAKLYAPEELRFVETLQVDSKTWVDPLLGAAVLTAGFALACGGRSWRLLSLTLVGVGGEFLYLFLDELHVGAFASTAVTAAVVGGVCVVLSKPLHLTSNAIMVVSLLALFPGMMIYQSMLGLLGKQSGAAELAVEALVTTYCLSVGGTAGQFIVSELLWLLRKAQFRKEFPDQEFSKNMVDEHNAQDIMLPVFSRPFSKSSSS
ncbi:threonine/serine exporter family protein [Rothia sp. LK2588]|uniref:threonine/serine exporter family protein n=1 Tax=Rothia sp. LK2588 TaxID=3114369 RepID=UPI0034CD7561